MIEISASKLVRLTSGIRNSNKMATALPSPTTLETWTELSAISKMSGGGGGRKIGIEQKHLSTREPFIFY